MLTHYIYVFSCLASCVSAEGWDDFANNLATDLAPLISLFGERITTQCLSESISVLDDFIFALAPLGILTAVVSAIRVRGNSTLRAFIGRAQEDPGAAERELLSCVSDSTAEIFSNSGVARINGNPKILEVVVDENPKNDGKPDIQRVSQLVKDDSSSEFDDGIRSPNLSLNKGIRRRAQFWFYLAAAFGVGLQAGVIIFAVLTVFRWPDVFQKNGHAVDGYALPMFINGTVILTLGMFFCAYVVETSSEKHVSSIPDESRVYWVQPGNQKVGDQVFPAFVGRTKKGVGFVRSIRHHSPNELWNLSKEVSLISIVSLSMVGFVMQFIGQRGLHSSVTLAQLGSTMVMTVVRTSLRAQRMHEGDNMLVDDQKLVSSGGHELDWLTFSLMKIQSFTICPVQTSSVQSTERSSQRLAQEAVDTRKTLRNLAGPHWNETLITGTAYNLARATLDLMKLINHWTNGDVYQVKVRIPIEVQGKEASETIRGDFEMQISVHDNLNSLVNSWEAILGLYVWSIRRAGHIVNETCQDFISRLFYIENKTTRQASLLLRKWVNGVLSIDTTMYPKAFLGFLNIFTGTLTSDHVAVVMDSSDLRVLAAQDIFIHILSSALGDLTSIGGNTSFSGADRSDYHVHNDHIEALANLFPETDLGSQKDGLTCTLQALSCRGMLPDIRLSSSKTRLQLEQIVLEGEYEKALSISEWLCSLAEYEEVESSLIAYAFFCLYGLMSEEPEAEELAIERILAIVNASYDDCSRNSRSKYLDHISNDIQEDWWRKFRDELHCIAEIITLYQAPHGLSEPRIIFLHKMGVNRGPESNSNDENHDSVTITASQQAYSYIWYAPASLHFPGSDNAYQQALDWIVKNRHNNMLEWLILRFTSNFFDRSGDSEMLEMMSYAAKQGYTEVLRLVSHHSENVRRLRDLLVEKLASSGDVQALELFLDHSNPNQITKDYETALLSAGEHQQLEVLEFTHRNGADLNVQDSTGETALMKAAMHGDIDSVKFLLAHGAELEKQDNDGDTALIHAAAKGHLRIVQLLAEKGANIDTQGALGRTALMSAVSIQSLPVVEYLLSQKADVRIENARKQTALDEALFAGLHGPWEEGYALLLKQPGAIRRVRQ